MTRVWRRRLSSEPEGIGCNEAQAALPGPQDHNRADGLPYLRRNLQEAVFHELYYQLAAIHWPLLLILLAGGFIAINFCLPGSTCWITG